MVAPKKRGSKKIPAAIVKYRDERLKALKRALSAMPETSRRDFIKK